MKFGDVIFKTLLFIVLFLFCIYLEQTIFLEIFALTDNNMLTVLPVSYTHLTLPTNSLV